MAKKGSSKPSKPSSARTGANGQPSRGAVKRALGTMVVGRTPVEVTNSSAVVVGGAKRSAQVAAALAIDN